MIDVATSAQRIWDALAARGSEPVMRRGFESPNRYEELTGELAPAEVTDLWSALGGRDILGMCLEGADSAGQMCAARANEAESSGPGVPYAELDGTTDCAVRKVWWDRAWCPLVATADLAIVVDSHPGATGHIGQVAYCNLDEDSDREAVWGSVSEFLRDVLTVVSSDALVVEDGHGRMPDPDGWDLTVTMAVLEVGRARRDGRPIPLPGIAGGSSPHSTGAGADRA
ncbi:hypothetical protein ACWF9G_04340 [Nocardia sp. NPDC055029]